MSRKLRRVPMDFSWPLNATWGGFVNPYYKLAAECPACDNGADRDKGRPDANAALFSAQWYGNAPFDPIAYGAEVSPLTREHPAYQHAVRCLERAPNFYQTDIEKLASDMFQHKALTGTFTEDDPTFVLFLTSVKERVIDAEARRLYDLWHGCWAHNLIQVDVDALVADDRLWSFTHTWSKAEGWQKRPDASHPTAAEVNLWSYEGMGHDSSNQFTCVKARCAREGVPFTCERCNGTAQIWPTPEIEEQCEAWKSTDPPTGEGYQLWETTSEGSPVSPVFKTLDELCAHAAVNCSTFGTSNFVSAQEWREMLDADFVHHREGNAIFL